MGNKDLVSLEKLSQFIKLISRLAKSKIRNSTFKSVRINKSEALKIEKGFIVSALLGTAWVFCQIHF